MNEAKGTALITGASSGIGALYADRLASQGYDLILVARNATKLERMAQAIREATGRQIDTLPADLTNPADLRLVEARLANDRSITLLVNTAGIGSTARLGASDWQDELRVWKEFSGMNIKEWPAALFFTF